MPTVEKLLNFYGATPQEIATFLQEAEEAKRPQWWTVYPVEVLPRTLHRFMSLESAASIIRVYEPHCVPALLRTEDYARAVLSARHPEAGTGLLNRHLDLVIERQQRFLGFGPTEASGGSPHRPTLWVILDETALRRAVGGPDVMRHQLKHLMTMTELPQVKIQVVRHLHGLYPGTLSGPFELFRFTAPELPDIVFRSSLDGGQYVEKGTSAYLEGFDMMSAGYAVPIRDTPALLHDIAQTVWDL
jgi:hypothetical protein